MNITSSYFQPLFLEVNQVYSFMFESAIGQYRFRKMLHDWTNGISNNYPYFQIEHQGQILRVKDMNIIHITHSIFEIQQDKEYIKFVTNYIKSEITHNITYQQLEAGLFQELEKFVAHLELKLPHGVVEFDLQTKWLEAILKSLTLDIIYETKGQDSLQMRKVYLDTLLTTTDNKKPTIILYECPDQDATIQEYAQLVHYLQGLNMTVVCLSSNIQFAKHFNAQNLKLLYNSGNTYTFDDLSKEMNLFDLTSSKLNAQQLTVLLGLYDFNKQYDVMDQQYISFLESSRK